MPSQYFSLLLARISKLYESLFFELYAAG